MSGRFYKTAVPQHMDYHMKYPSELLFKAIAKKDAEVDQEIQSTELINQGLMAQEAKAKGSLGRGMYSQQDEEDYKAEVGGFETEIGEITQSIYDDPYGKSRMRDISDVRSRVAASMTTGNLAMFNKNFNASKDFLEANKDIDPNIVAAAYKEGIDAWGKTIDDKTGEYRTLSFRSNLQDVNIADEAYTQAKRVSNTLGTTYRTTLTKANLKNDKEVMQTLWQNVELGLVPIVEGEGGNRKIIAPQDASYDQKRIAIDKEIERQAVLAVETTKAYSKASGKSSGAKEDKTVYAPDRAYISPEGTGLTRQSIAGRALKIGSDYSKSTTSEGIILDYKINVDNAIKNEAYETGAKYFYLVMESAVLGYYIDMIKSLSGQPEYSSEHSTGMMKATLPKESFVDNERKKYITAITADNTISVVGGWGGDRFEEKIYEQGVKSVNDFIKDKSRFNNTPLEDNMGRFAGKSVNDMIDAGVIIPVIENPKYIKNVKDELNMNYGVLIDQVEKSKRNGEYILTMYVNKIGEGAKERKERLDITGYKVEEENSPYTGAPSYKVEIPLPDVKESATEFENFKILEGKPIPTLTINPQGGNYFRKPALLNNEIIDLYIGTKAVGDNDYLKAENAERMDNYLSTLHSMMRAERSKGLSESFTFTLFSSDVSTTNIEVAPEGFIVRETTIDEATGQSITRVASPEDSKRILMGIMYSLPQSYEE